MRAIFFALAIGLFTQGHAVIEHIDLGTGTIIVNPSGCIE